MQNTKRFILMGCIAASALISLTGCHTEDRSMGQVMDDKRIARRVEGNLNSDPVYKYSDVNVSVFQGVAQLSGFVDTQSQVRSAALLAARTDGVREVINDIAIKPQFELVPAAQRANRTSYNNAGAAGGTWEEEHGTYRQQNAPIITPNQGSPATQPTGNYKDKDSYKDKDKNNTSNQ